jgi:hypothetical protein
MVADSLHPFTPTVPVPLLQLVMGFSPAAVSGGNVIIDGTTGLDPSTGYNGLYLGTPGGNGVVSEQLNSVQQLPGNSNANFHTRYDRLLAMDGNLVAFTADDSNTLTYHGLYTTTPGSHTINTIADVNSTLPGLGPLSAIAPGGISVSQGSILFRAADTTPGSTANNLYIWKNGSSSRIIGSGDTLDGVKIPPLPGILDPGPGALFGSSFAFNPYRSAIYLAAPASSAVSISAITNAASGSTASVAPGEIVTLYGAGLGPASLAYFQFGANNLMPTQLAGVRVLFNGNPAPLIYASNGQVSAIVPFAVDGQSTAQIEVENNGAISSSVIVPITNTLPALFSANSSGSGQGAIQNGDGSYNRASNAAAAVSDQLRDSGRNSSGSGRGRRHRGWPTEPAQFDRCGEVVNTRGRLL